MKVIVAVLLIFVSIAFAVPTVKLAKSSGAGSFIYLSSCEYGGYYYCGSSGSVNVDIQCELIDTTGELDDNDSGGILQLVNAKHNCENMVGDDGDFYVITLYGEPNTIIIENIHLEDTFNGAALNTFCNNLDQGCEESKVYGKNKYNGCSTTGWDTYGKFGQLKLESDAQYSRCATYLIEAQATSPNEGLVHGGFNCGNTCPDFEPEEEPSLSFDSSFIGTSYYAG